MGLCTLFVKFRRFNLDGGRRGVAVGDGGIGAGKLLEDVVVSVVLVDDDDARIHIKEGGLVCLIFSGGGGAKSGGNVIGKSGNINWEAVENILFQRFSWGGDDDVVSAGLPSVAEKLVKSTNFNIFIGGEASDMLAGSTENLVDVMSDFNFAGGAGDTD